ncbi:MAG: TPM domain-containing protein [Pseudomonadota bacterium]
MKRFLAALLLLVSAPSWAAELAAPTLTRRVTDQTGTLSAAQIDQLESFLSEFETKTSNQIVALLIPSLEGREIREFGVDVAQKNKAGQKGKDNGALLLIAKNDRKISIEVGYGLEGVLPDAVCDQIIRHEITPRFRAGDYFGGIQAGLTSIANAAIGQYKTPERSRGSGNPLAALLLRMLFPLLFIILFLQAIVRSHRVSSGGYRRGPGFWGGGFGGLGGGGFGGFGGGGFSGGGGSFGGGGASGGW